MLIKRALMLIASLTLFAFMSTTVAQDQQENDGLAQVVLITAKDGQELALEKAITNYHHYMADKEGAFRFQWYSVITGPDTGTYVARSGSHNWEDFDATHDWDEAAGDKFLSEVQPYIESADFRITRTDKDLGIWPDSIKGYQYFLITDWYIKSGQIGAFNKGLKKIDGILKEGGWSNYYSFVHTVSGGKGNQITLVSPRKSYADMAPKEPSFIQAMNKALGEEEAAAFLAKWGPSYYPGQNRMLKYRPKLSDYGDGK
jgi:hypothetical protein